MPITTISMMANRAKMTVVGTPGTGNITLGAAALGFQSFAAAGVTNQTVISYVIEDGSNWEIGQGLYTTTGTTLTRTSILASSSGGATISVSSAALVYITALASDLGLGYFPTLAALNAAYPIPLEGMKAYVKNVRKIGIGETSGNGTGVWIYYSIGFWRLIGFDEPALT